MTQSEFKKIAKKCPWYYHNGQPLCRGVGDGLNCCKKNCAPFYFVQFAINNHEHRNSFGTGTLLK